MQTFPYVPMGNCIPNPLFFSSNVKVHEVHELCTVDLLLGWEVLYQPGGVCDTANYLAFEYHCRKPCPYCIYCSGQTSSAGTDYRNIVFLSHSYHETCIEKTGFKTCSLFSVYLTPPLAIPPLKRRYPNLSVRGALPLYPIRLRPLT